MFHRKILAKIAIVSSALLALFALARCAIPPDWGANALVHPYRHHAAQNPRDVGLAEEDLAVTVADGVELRGWLVRATGTPHRGLIVYFHGVSDTRQSGIGLAQHFGREGWDVAAFDARAHGDSGGEFCTYGFYERGDVPKLLDALAAHGVDAAHTVLIGSSMGAATSLQAAPDEPRVRGVVAMAAFSTLRLAAYERKPYVMSDYTFRASVRRAEDIAKFRVDDVAPVDAVKKLHVPLLLIHGEKDEETPAAHSQRLYAAASMPKKLVIVPGAGHNTVLSQPGPWQEIRAFLADVK